MAKTAITKDQTAPEDQKARPTEAAAGAVTTPPGTGDAVDAGAAASAAVPAEAAPVEAKPAKAKAVVDNSVLIRGPAKGRWRAGRFFGPEPVELLINDLTEDEKVALAGDPELTIIWNS